MHSITTSDQPSSHDLRRMQSACDILPNANSQRDIHKSYSLPSNLVDDDCQFEYFVEVSMLEIYNEMVSSFDVTQKLDIRSDQGFTY